MPCTECDDPACNGQTNQLREYESWKQLAAHCDEETILAWVNELALSKVKVRAWGKRYRLRQQAFAKLAKAQLDPDEIERMTAHVEEHLDDR